MALPLPPTLEQLQEAVSIRVGLFTSGKLSKSMEKIITEHINQAQREIFMRCAWARLLVEQEISTAQGVRDYDIPDLATSVAGIQQVLVVNTDGRRFQLDYDDALALEASTTQVETASRPRTWQIVNDVMRLSPAVDAANYPTLVVYLVKGDKPLVNGQDRACVDREALVQYVTILVKEYLGVGGSQAAARETYRQYLIDLRSANTGPGRSFNIASELPTGVPYWRYPTVAIGVSPYSPSWNPW